MTEQHDARLRARAHTPADFSLAEAAERMVAQPEYNSGAKLKPAPKLPTADSVRKATPIFSGVLKYFPRALAAVAEVSLIGNEKHNPGQPLHWSRAKSGDELDALTRHLLEAGTFDTDGVRHSARVAWRALANLEKELEASEGDGQPDEDRVRSTSQTQPLKQ